MCALSFISSTEQREFIIGSGNTATANKVNVFCIIHHPLPLEITDWMNRKVFGQAITTSTKGKSETFSQQNKMSSSPIVFRAVPGKEKIIIFNKRESTKRNGKEYESERSKINIAGSGTILWAAPKGKKNHETDREKGSNRFIWWTGGIGLVPVTLKVGASSTAGPRLPLQAQGRSNYSPPSTE